MAADSDAGALSVDSPMVPASVAVSVALRASAATSSVTYSGLPAAPSASCSKSLPGLPPARAVISSATASSGSLVSWSRAPSPAARRKASKSSRCGTGRIIPANRSGIWCADRASRAHSVTRSLVGPLEVVNDQDGGLRRALLRDQRQQLFGQLSGHVSAAVSSKLTAQQPDDGATPWAVGLLADPQCFQQRQQR